MLYSLPIYDLSSTIVPETIIVISFHHIIAPFVTGSNTTYVRWLITAVE